MRIHIENIAPQPIVYMRQTGPYGKAQNFELMKSMKQWIRDRGLWSEAGTIYGIAQDNAAVTLPEKCRYDLCFVVEAGFQDDTIRHGALPAGTYLVFEVLHTVDEIKRFWAGVVDSLAREKRQIDASRPILERYQIGLVEKGLCEFCVPVIAMGSE